MCAIVAERACSVRTQPDAIAPYAHALPLDTEPPEQPPPRLPDREQRAAFWLQLDAINFGSGWFPTLSKRDGLSGYGTIAAALQDRADRQGPWSAAQLTELDAATVAGVLGQPADHELMVLYARSLVQLGELVLAEHGGSFAAVADAAGGSAVALAQRLAAWPCFADSSRYDELEIPFLKRAQIAAADLHRAAVTEFDDLAGLTMFADNLVPHVLRLDGVLSFDPRARRADRPRRADRAWVARGGRDPRLRPARRRVDRRRPPGRHRRRRRPAAVAARRRSALQGLAAPPVALHGLLTASEAR